MWIARRRRYRDAERNAAASARTAPLRRGSETREYRTTSDGVPVTVACPQNNGFKLSPEALEASITPRTRWLVINNPTNPSGALYSRAELAALADVLLRHPRVGVVADNLYEHMIFDGREFATIAAVEPRVKDRALIVNGVSKAYAMMGGASATRRARARSCTPWAEYNRTRPHAPPRSARRSRWRRCRGRNTCCASGRWRWRRGATGWSRFSTVQPACPACRRRAHFICLHPVLVSSARSHRTERRSSARAILPPICWRAKTWPSCRARTAAHRPTCA
jgi:hypothetical protein